MAATTPAPSAQLDELRLLAQRLRDRESDVDALRAERAALYAALHAAGYSHRKIAEAAGVTPMAVKFVLDKAAT